MPGIRAALCGDAETADGARKWNDANVLALSLRTTSQALLGEILDAWFAGEPSSDEDDAANVRHVGRDPRSLRGPAKPARTSKKRGGAPDTAPLWTRPNRVMQAIHDLGLAHR